MFFRDNMWPYGRLQYILHQLNLDWLVKQVKQNTDDIEDIREHGGGGGVTPDISATATVDDNTGVPSVSVAKSGTAEAPNFAFNFHNLKGAKGDTGVTPDISATATVDDTTGTPNVNVVDSGTLEAPHFAFNFTGLKGATGVAGRDGTDGVTPVISATASVNSSTGTPSVSVTRSGTDAAPSFAFAFSNLKGARGDTGDRGPAGPSGDALPRYDVSNMYATIPDTIANAYLNGRVPFYMLLANGGSSSVTKSSINISSASYPGATVYCATNPVEVPAYDAVLVKFYWSGSNMYFDTVSSGGGGGGGLSTVNFTLANGFRYYDSEYQPQQTIEWARRYEPITLVASTNINPGSDIGTIDDASIHGRGTMLVFNSNQGFTGIYFYTVENGHVYAQTTIQSNCRVTLF